MAAITLTPDTPDIRRVDLPADVAALIRFSPIGPDRVSFTIADDQKIISVFGETRIVGYHYEPGREAYCLVVEPDGRSRNVKLREKLRDAGRPIAFRRDGRAIAYTTEYPPKFVEIDLDTEATVELASGLVYLSPQYLDDNRLVAVLDGALVVLQRDGAALRSVASLKIKGYEIAAALGRFVFAKDKKSWTVYAIDGDKIAKLDSFKQGYGTVHDIDGEVWLQDFSGRSKGKPDVWSIVTLKSK